MAIPRYPLGEGYKNDATGTHAIVLTYTPDASGDVCQMSDSGSSTSYPPSGYTRYKTAIEAAIDALQSTDIAEKARLSGLEARLTAAGIA